MAIIDQPDTPEVKEVLFPPTKGMVNNRRSFHLGVDETVTLRNANTTIEGERSKSAGLWPRGCPETGATLPCTLLASIDLTGYDASSNPRVILGKWGNAVWSSNDDATTWTHRSSGISLSSTYYQSAVVSGNVYLCSCVSPTEANPEVYSNLVGISPTTGWTATETTITARAICSYLNRLWFIKGNYLYWSKKGGILTSTGNIRFYDSDRNVAVTPVREGLPSLLIWRENSIWILENISWTTDGYDLEATNDTLDYTLSRIRPIVEGVGLVAPRGVIWVPGAPGGGDYFFLANDGIRSLNRSLSDVQAGATLPISDRIHGTTRSINWNYANRSCAAQWEGTAYFSVPAESSTEPSLTIAYDSHRDAFSIRDWDATSFAVHSYANKSRRLYFASASPSSESYSGTDRYGYQVYQVDCSSDDYGGGTTGLSQQPIQYTEITRSLSFDIEPPPNEIRRKKRWSYTELQIQPGATNATLSLSYRLDEGASWNTLATIDVPASATATLIRRKYSMQNIRPGYYLQFLLQDTTSYADWKIVHWNAYAYPLNPTFE